MNRTQNSEGSCKSVSMAVLLCRQVCRHVKLVARSNRILQIPSGFQTGFSFVEVLFAIILLGVLIAPVFTLLTQSSSGTVQNRNDILAQQHATNLLAYAYSLPFDHAFLNAGPVRTIKDLSVTANAASLDLGMEEDIFTRTIEIDEQKPADWPHAYKILTVKVRWKQANESAREIKVAGLVSQ